MSHGIALWKGDTWDAGPGTLHMDDAATVTLTTPAGAASVTLTLGRSSFLDVRATDTWLVAVPAADSPVLLGRFAEPSLVITGNIARSPRTGPDAIGVHAVRVHDRPGADQCLLSWECGAALVDPAGGILWSFVHDDVDQRVMKITHDTVQLMGVSRSFTVQLADGAATAAEVDQALAVDRETLAEWRRGIGR